MNNEFLSKEEEIVNTLKTIYDPEIPVNIYDLGLIYEVNVNKEGESCCCDDTYIAQLPGS